MCSSSICTLLHELIFTLRCILVNLNNQKQLKLGGTSYSTNSPEKHSFQKRSPHLLRFCHDRGEEGLQRPSWLQVPIKPRLAVLQHAPITPSYCFPPLCMCNVHLCEHQHTPITLSFYFPPLNSSCPNPSTCTWPCSPTCTCNADHPTIITYHLINQWS